MILNVKRHARELTERMAGEEVLHLSTSMCPAHRKAVLAEIDLRLEQGRSAVLISTQCVEAGVDLDFPHVYRAMGPLDSIAQAAGRCNREGLASRETSEVLVFGSDPAQWKPPPELKQFADVARGTLRRFAADPLQPAAVTDYFEELYWTKGTAALDEYDLLGLLRGSKIDSLPFETLARHYRIISSVQMPVLVPFDDEAREALRALRHAESALGLARRLQRYIVQIPRAAYRLLREAGAVQPIAPEKWGEQFMELVNESLYDESCGLAWENPAYLQVQASVW